MDWTFEELAALQSEHDAEGAAQVADELREVGLTEYTAGRLPLHPEIAAAAAEADDPCIRWSGLAHPSVQASRAAINKAKKAKKAARPTGVTTLAAGESAIRRDFADGEVSGFERADYFRNHLTPRDLFTAENLQVVWDKTGRFQKGKSIDWKATRQVDEFVLLSPDMPAATRQAVIERGEAEALGRPMAWEARSLATSAERLAELAASTTSRSQLHRVAGKLGHSTRCLGADLPPRRRLPRRRSGGKHRTARIYRGSNGASRLDRRPQKTVLQHRLSA